MDSNFSPESIVSILKILATTAVSTLHLQLSHILRETLNLSVISNTMPQQNSYYNRERTPGTSSLISHDAQGQWGKELLFTIYSKYDNNELFDKSAIQSAVIWDWD